mmetsp:Transcript_1830/g.2595  ORF Transcript_1830/g.2595 Transcript_1830/m.2595 type:complete len:166 (-) Transcript_1830:175-672(-)
MLPRQNFGGPPLLLMLMFVTAFESMTLVTASKFKINTPLMQHFEKQKLPKLFKCKGNPRSAKPKYSVSNAPAKRKFKPGTHRYSKIGKKITARISEKVMQITAGKASIEGYHFRSPLLKKMAEHGKMLLSQRGKQAKQLRRANKVSAKTSFRPAGSGKSKMRSRR